MYQVIHLDHRALVTFCWTSKGFIFFLHRLKSAFAIKYFQLKSRIHTQIRIDPEFSYQELKDGLVKRKNQRPERDLVLVPVGTMRSPQGCLQYPGVADRP